MTVAFIAGCGGSSKRSFESLDAAGAADTPIGTGGAGAADGSAADGGLSDVIGTVSTGGSTGTGGAAMGGTATGIAGGVATGGNVSVGGSPTGGGGATGGLGNTGGATATGGNTPTGGTAGTGGASLSGVTSAGGWSAIGGNTPMGGTAGAGGASRSGGARVGGSSATGGNAGSGGSGTGDTCDSYTLSGNFELDGHTAFKFDTVTATLHHKRDVDANEDRCFNAIIMTFSIGGACKLEVRISSSNTCLVHSPTGLYISSIRLEADSQCPGIPDAEEGIYTATATNLNGATIFTDTMRIGEANVASSCVEAGFNLTLAGSLRNTATGGILRFPHVGPPHLYVEGKFLSTEGPGACPATDCPGCHSLLSNPCRPGEFCTSNSTCAYPGTWTSCTDFNQCSGKSDCLSTPAGLQCREACTSNSECYVGSSTAKPVCFAASNGDKTCQYDCSVAGSTCPSGLSCKSYAAGKFCD